MMLGSSSSVLVFVLCVVAACAFMSLAVQAQAQNQTQATLDPYEASILDSIFQKWDIGASTQWNVIKGDPCMGAATNDSAFFDDSAYNPFIKCNCSFKDKTSCHITHLKVYALDAGLTIPEELWNLTYLSHLNLAQNYLTGPLSPSIGKLTRMQYLTLGINGLSGMLPKDLGNLTDLLVLGLGSNNFSGSLPSELGNLVNLEQFYFDSAGVTGEIPPSFANLRNLAIVWASDNELTGKTPDFIGNWAKLQTLRLEGNSFEGPIPSTISTLTYLVELRISDVSNGGSSLAFIKDMESLSILVLRNNNISSSIPSNIGEKQSLMYLDLSFNSLNGSIPDSLFSISSLAYLFLGNNKLTGTLPTSKSASLLNIDLSYNNLDGGLPVWADNQTLQLNLVANNFPIGGSNSSGLLSQLYCLQRNFPCYRGAGIYSDFAINSGGPQITSSNGVVYENDNETLGPASYFVTKTNRWAVSNVGLFSGSNNPLYKINSTSLFTNTLDSDLFQTARISPSSLRYYGLGLENGYYMVSLQFAETAILNSISWKSRGRRVFDIYIQGNRVLEDFDIQKEAGGISFQAVEKKFTAKVSENYLEIHFFWAGKGTCCIPSQGTYGPLVSAIQATRDPTLSDGKINQTGLIVGIVVGVGVASFLVVFMVCFVVRRRKLRNNDDEELLGMVSRPYTFSYAELKAATEDFNPANKLGEGGFGPVFKGTLHDERVIAVKQLSVTSRQGKSQFVAEIATISAVQHRNLVKLYGCCIEGDKRLLVYEYLENKSLDQALFRKRSLNLDWPTRYNICIGVARGLAYLHEESRLRIVHRDVKASNILLDADLVPKISDFGLAKLYDDKNTHISTRVAGTIGYLAPEYAMRGRLTEKADVFAFGVVALELVSGRPNSDPSLEEEKMYLLDWAWHLHENRRDIDLVDSRLPEFDEEEVKRVIEIGLLCTQTSPSLRQPMSRVVGMLAGDVEVSPVTSRPVYFTDFDFDDDANIFTGDSTTGGTDDSVYSALAVASAEQSPTIPLYPSSKSLGYTN